MAWAVSSLGAFPWLGAVARQVLILFTLLYIQHGSVWQVMELEVKNLGLGKSIGETELKESSLNQSNFRQTIAVWMLPFTLSVAHLSVLVCLPSSTITMRDKKFIHKDNCLKKSNFASFFLNEHFSQACRNEQLMSIFI